MPTVYLERANGDLINHCQCKRSLVAVPGQMDCPWCGCGWLFTCMKCRKAYAFARGFVIDASLEDLGRQDLQTSLGRAPHPQELTEWVATMGVLLRNVQPGCTYVYFDGHLIDARSSGVRFEGIHSRHELPYVPQVRALRDPRLIEGLLADEQYWLDRAVTPPAASPTPAPAREPHARGTRAFPLILLVFSPLLLAILILLAGMPWQRTDHPVPIPAMILGAGLGLVPIALVIITGMRTADGCPNCRKWINYFRFDTGRALTCRRCRTTWRAGDHSLR